jgi:hypothetical protein
VKVGSGIYSLCAGAWLGVRLISYLQLVYRGKDQVLADGRGIRGGRSVVVFVSLNFICKYITMFAKGFQNSIVASSRKRGVMTEVIKSGRKAKKEGDVSE